MAISIYQSMLPDLSWTHNIEDILLYMDHYYKVLKYFKSKYPEIIMDINLEEFTEKSEELAKKMFKFCGLTWNENINNFYNRRYLYSKTLSFNQIRSKVLKYNDKDKGFTSEYYISKPGERLYQRLEIFKDTNLLDKNHLQIEV